MPICMNDDGTMNEMCGKYAGMDRFECRKELVRDFEAAGVVDHIDEHLHQVGHSERTGVIVEPYLSKQWFVKMKPLAQAVLKTSRFRIRKSALCPNGSSIPSHSGWRTSRTGAFPVSCGGDTGSLHGPMKNRRAVCGHFCPGRQ